jgi:hypothetical protein
LLGFAQIDTWHGGETGAERLKHTGSTGQRNARIGAECRGQARIEIKISRPVGQGLIGAQFVAHRHTSDATQE